MTIRTRLALQFMLLASLILGGAFAVVYLLSANYRVEEFIGRLKDRGANTAKLLIQVDEVDERLLEKIEITNPVRLPEEVIHVFDHHNKELFRLGTTADGAVSPSLLDSVRLHGEQVGRRGDREEVAFLFTDRFDRFVVVASGNDIYGRSKLRNQGRVMIATFLIGQVLIFLIGRFYSSRALSPVQRLSHQIKNVTAADLTHHVTVGNEQDELAQLAGSFNELLDRLQDAFTSQRNFIANASHEMRTPLTTISGQLDVLLLKARTQEEYASALRSVLDDMHALNRLADRLLLMAQAENKAPRSSFAPVRLDEVLWQSRTEVMKADANNRVELTMEDVEGEEDLTVMGNENLLRSLFINLIENACKYAPDKRAFVSIGVSSQRVQVAVEDNGPGIPAVDKDRIFEPFYRATNTGGAKGHGIGLSLAKRIAELHDGQIRSEQEPGRGARFVVYLPKAG